MRGVSWILCLVILAGSSIWAQEDATTLPPPKPDAEGVYFVGPQVTAPKLVRVMTVGYPFDGRAGKVAGFTVLSMVIGADGLPIGIEVLHTHGAAYDAAAIAAVKQSKFAPGTLAGKPVPVRIDVRVSFHANQAQAVPVVVIAERDLPVPEVKLGKKGPPSYTPPMPIHTVDADFVDPTVKSKYDTVAIVTVDVSVEGLPTQVRIRRGLGFGADERAVAAVKQYRFLPAIDKGKPVAASREVEVKFAVF